MFPNSLDLMCQKFGIDKSQLEGVDVLVLPENLDAVSSKAELKDTVHGVMLAKQMKAEGIQCKTAFDLGVTPKVSEKRSNDLWMGVVWLLNDAQSQIILNMLASYFYDRLKLVVTPTDGKTTKVPKASAPIVEIDLKMQRGHQISELRFKGLGKDLVSILNALKDQE